jgi:hypothetical protein
MALTRFKIEGYGQLELNQAPFRRSGRIEAQCKLAAEIPYVENGMLLAVNRKTRTVAMPTGAEDEVIALNYTTEHMYDERERALKHFRLDNGTFLPRLGYVALGDKWTTNCIAYDTDEFADETALKEALEAVAETALYGVPCELGAIKVTATKPAGFCVEVVKATTMPDGQYAVQFAGL